ncbi:pesticidal protein Cry2Aa [Bengtsoniella intestinalis]
MAATEIPRFGHHRGGCGAGVTSVLLFTTLVNINRMKTEEEEDDNEV